MDILQRAKQLLAPFMGEDQRDTWLTLAFHEHRSVYDAIQKTGATADFTVRCVSRLLDRGCLGSRHALSVLLDVVRDQAGDDKQEAFQALIEELDRRCVSNGVSESAQTESAIPNPYPGLEAFKPEDHRFFFGRDEDTARVVTKLRETWLVSVVGPSGTGKSSLVAAGVVPKLREKESGLAYLRFKPQTDPFRQLAEALDRALPEKRTLIGPPRAERIAQLLKENPTKAVADHFSTRLILLFADQFEELFVQTPPEIARHFRNVFDALRQVDLLRVALTLRSEFMHRLMEWLGGALFETSLAPLDPITQPDRLRAIIVRPAEENGVAVEPELVSTLLSASGATKGALPLVALTLQKLFEQRDPQKGLTLHAYKTMGGLESVVETAAADIEKDIQGKPELERACERLFGEVATVIDELPTRRTAEVRPLRADPQVGMLIEALRAQGFITDPDEAHIELAHETLFRHWPRLSTWCARYANDLSIRRQVEQAAKDWQRSDRRAALAWDWELQKPALQALLALGHLSAVPHSDFTDSGICAWQTLQSELDEPLRSFLHPEPLRLLNELDCNATPHHRREEIGLRLNQMRDPRRGVGLDANGIPDIDWIEIPAGTVALDSKFVLETVTRETFEVEQFRLARYPVTWAQYRAFLDAEDGYCKAAWWEGRPREREPGALLWPMANYPAVDVSWYDAMAYCRWLSAKLRLDILLPTEWQWQRATRGPNGEKRPWPGDWNVAHVDSFEAGIKRRVAVGTYPLRRSPLGVDDIGNVWEWCLNQHKELRLISLGVKAPRALRGSWGYTPATRPAAFRDHGPYGRLGESPDSRTYFVGFRVCHSSLIE